MSTYQTGHIYKIVNEEQNIIYVGSTFQNINKRFGNHKSLFNKWLKNKDGIVRCAIFPFFEQFGINSFGIKLLKSYEVCKTSSNDSKHLRAYEQLWMCKLKCINKLNAIDFLNKERLQLLPNIL